MGDLFDYGHGSEANCTTTIVLCYGTTTIVL